MRQRNRHYHVPGVTTQLGAVLDLQIELDDQRMTIAGWEGWHLLTDENAIDRAPGKAKLYLLPGELEPLERPPNTEAAEQTYRDWHRRAAERVGELEVTDHPIGFYQGRVLRLGYRSDKWSKPGNAVDYDHDFREGGALAPMLYTDRARIDDSTAALIVGGDMRVTPAGID